MKRILIYLVVVGIFLSGCSQATKQNVDKSEKAKPAVEEKSTLPSEARTESQAKEEISTESAKKTNETEKTTATSATSSSKKTSASQTKPVTSSAKKSSQSSQAVSSAEVSVAPTQSGSNTGKPAVASSKSVAPPTDVAKEENIVYISICGVDDQASIMSKQKVNFEEGDSVFDVLLRETKSRKIQMEFSGLKSAAYIKGIDNLYEFDKGEGSGWLYTVNGNFPKESCSAYKLKKGDSIEWKYTKDSGKDVGKKTN